MKFTEYLAHLRKWWAFYSVIWIVILGLSTAYSAQQYQRLPKDRYAATGVYRAEDSRIAIEWAYLARLQDNTSSRVPIEEGPFFEITVSGKNKDTLVATVNDVLVASRNEQENVLEIRKPKPRLISTRRSIASQASTSFAVALAAMAFIHGIVAFKFMKNDDYEHCPGCDCGKIGASTHAGS